jgi:amino acid transporter
MPTLTVDGGLHRPRNVDWKRAAALLYGDWGTSKAYVLGLAFLAAGFSSLPIILAVCALTGLVGINYAIICKYFPDGGGVYSAARSQGRLLAVVGALLLVADLTVTAALSCWSALSYFNIAILKEHIVLSTVGVLLVMGLINFFGPKHSGSLAVVLAVPTVLAVIALIIVSAPHLTTRYLEPLHESYQQIWVQFCSVILALSGVEAIANLTGVMKLDKGSTIAEPRVGREAAKAIWPVAVEVVVATALLGWAMLSMNPNWIVQLWGSSYSIRDALGLRSEDMLRFIGEYFGSISFGPLFGQAFGWVVGIVFFLLLLSAANTAIVAMIGLLYIMTRDQEMPRQFMRLNRNGVPLIPLLIAVGLPVVVIVATRNFTALAGLYAIGVVGAITVNLLFQSRSADQDALPCAAWCYVYDSLPGRNHPRPHQTGRALFRAMRDRSWLGRARLDVKAAWFHYSHGSAKSGGNGDTRSRHHHATTFSRRPKGYGCGPRHQSGAEFCP